MLHGKGLKNEKCLPLSDLSCSMEKICKSFLQQPNFHARKVLHASYKNFFVKCVRQLTKIF